MRALIALLSLPALLAGCAAGGDDELSGAERAALVDSIKLLANEMVETIDRHDVDGFIAYHWHNPDFVWASSGEIIPLESHHAGMKEYFSGPGQNVHFELAESRVHVLSRDAAVATCIIHSSSIGEDGEPRSGHEAWSIVVQRINGEWKVVQAHESYPRRPAP
jgi:ketosteroid isomerase-like protein